MTDESPRVARDRDREAAELILLASKVAACIGCADLATDAWPRWGVAGALLGGLAGLVGAYFTTMFILSGLWAWFGPRPAGEEEP